ncbi:MAG TPA: PP2C family serine/threonine-protein phosphatase [Thermomicrobiales bacterium]|nr:PP2C family serine/threonine-protein phosphatase [Thermomicrobiales bacterium]
MSAHEGAAPGGEIRSSTGGLVVAAVGQTDIGCQRQINQDTLGNLAQDFAGQTGARGLLYAVADGMGGHARGEVASALAIKHVFALYYATDPDLDPEQSLARTLVATNAAVHEAGRAEGGSNMGTTLTTALFRNNRLFVGNIGDSRTYRVRGGNIEQLTHDHSLIGEQVRSGLLSEAEARQSNIRNVITRAVGYREEVEPDTFAYPIAVGDVILLCSDGLHGLVEDAELAQVLSTYPLAEAVRALIELARQRGGPDNITALAIRVDQVEPAPASALETTQTFAEVHTPGAEDTQPFPKLEPLDEAAPAVAETAAAPPPPPPTVPPVAAAPVAADETPTLPPAPVADDETPTLPLPAEDAPAKPAMPPAAAPAAPRGEETTQPMAAAPDEVVAPAPAEAAEPAAPAVTPPAPPPPTATPPKAPKTPKTPLGAGPLGAGASPASAPAANPPRRAPIWLFILVALLVIVLVAAFAATRLGSRQPGSQTRPGQAVAAAAPTATATPAAPTPTTATPKTPLGAGAPAATVAARSAETGRTTISGQITAGPATTASLGDGTWTVALRPRAARPGDTALANADIMPTLQYRLSVPDDAPAGPYVLTVERKGDPGQWFPCSNTPVDRLPAGQANSGYDIKVDCDPAQRQ